MKIAVITPYHKEKIEVIERCHLSVCQQTIQQKNIEVDHWLISDGYPQPMIDTWDAKHVTLPEEHSDYGNTPRGIGGILARQTGDYDFVAYLDADNWYDPNHLLQLLVEETNFVPDVICGRRRFYNLDGIPLANAHETKEVQGKHVDTNCFLIYKTAFSALDIWLNIPPQISIIGDRIFLQALQRRKFSFLFSERPSVCYTSLWRAHYLSAGHPPPKNAKVLGRNHLDWLSSLSGAQATVDALGFLPTP